MAAWSLCACEFFDDKDSSQADQLREAETLIREKQAADEAGRALAAGMADRFMVSPEELKLLNTAPAINPLGTINGFFTNSQGVSGYFQGFAKPFNFIWTGRTEALKAFDGRTYQVMSGQGRMLLKYMDDDRLVQSYEGEAACGLLEGFGEQWSRNIEAEGHHYFSYRGEFKHDQMDGRGTLSDYNFAASGSRPTKYEGEFKNNMYHGQGRAFDLATGQMLYKGLWLGGQTFQASQSQWAEADEEYRLEGGNGFSGVLMTDEIEVAGLVPETLDGALFIWPALNTETVRAVDQTGHKYSFGRIENVPEMIGEVGGEFTIFGCREKRPITDYPLTLDIRYEREGRPHFLRFTVLRPQVVLFYSDLVQNPPDDYTTKKLEEIEAKWAEGGVGQKNTP